MSLSPIPRAVSLRFDYEAVRVTSHNNNWESDKLYRSWTTCM